MHEMITEVPSYSTLAVYPCSDLLMMQLLINFMRKQLAR